MNKIGLLEVNTVLPEMEIIQVRFIWSIVDNALSHTSGPGDSLWRHHHAWQEPLLSRRRRHRHCEWTQAFGIGGSVDPMVTINQTTPLFVAYVVIVAELFSTKTYTTFILELPKIMSFVSYHPDGGSAYVVLD